MVQLQNPDRLSLAIKFGTIDDQDTDVNGLPTSNFVSRGSPTLCGLWSLTTNQMIQMAGLQQTDNTIVVVHHKNDWSGITHAYFKNHIYKVVNINQDPYTNPTAYDLITIRKVSDANG
ncbi:MAG: hypothetical protein J6586_04575 [Snodgrassella sp.]|nr:hypothetical protein [Snodgrassella sp.]MCO6528597.1 head-tail adaptor protein [Lactobacillus sp.]